MPVFTQSNSSRLPHSYFRINRILTSDQTLGLMSEQACLLLNGHVTQNPRATMPQFGAAFVSVSSSSSVETRREPSVPFPQCDDSAVLAMLFVHYFLAGSHQISIRMRSELIMREGWYVALGGITVGHEKYSGIDSKHRLFWVGYNE